MAVCIDNNPKLTSFTLCLTALSWFWIYVSCQWRGCFNQTKIQTSSMNEWLSAVKVSLTQQIGKAAGGSTGYKVIITSTLLWFLFIGFTAGSKLDDVGLFVQVQWRGGYRHRCVIQSSTVMTEKSLDNRIFHDTQNLFHLFTASFRSVLHVLRGFVVHGWCC